MDPEAPSHDSSASASPPGSVSIDDIVKDISQKADASGSSSSSPVDASETLLVSVPDAIAHLVDREASPHLASGPFSIIRLDQAGNGIAVFARVAKELQWPLTQDQAAVKLDPFHYFFAVTVPPEIGREEGGAASPVKDSAAAEKTVLSGNDSLLNYGITFNENTDVECLKQLDEVLKQYSCFKAPQVSTKERGEEDENIVASGKDQKTVEKDPDMDVTTAVDLTGIPADAYWTALAPNVEDYSNGLARAIATGAGQIIRGIFWCSETTIAQLEKGHDFMQARIKASDAPAKISPATMSRIQQVRKISAMSEQFVGGVLSGVIKAAAFVARPLVTSKVGQKLLSLMPGQVALASLDGFGKIFDALEVAGKNVLTTSSTTTTGLVTQRYGGDAGQFTEQGFNALGGFLTTAWTVSKLQRVFNPGTFMKSAAKVANEDRGLRDQTSQPAQIAMDGDDKPSAK